MQRADHKSNNAMMAANNTQAPPSQQPIQHTSPAEKVLNIKALSKYIAHYIPDEDISRHNDYCTRRPGFSSLSLVNKATFDATRNIGFNIRLCFTQIKTNECRVINIKTDRTTKAIIKKAQRAMYNILDLYRYDRDYYDRNAHHLWKDADNTIAKMLLITGRIFKYNPEYYTIDGIDSKKIKPIDQHSNYETILNTTYIIILSGNTDLLKTLFKQTAMHQKRIENFLDILKMLTFSILSGNITMIVFIKEWVGDIMKYFPPKNIPPSLIQDHLCKVQIMAAIFSGKASIVNFILKNININRLQNISSKSALECWKQAFNSQNISIMQLIKNNKDIKNALRWTKKKHIAVDELQTLCLMINRNPIEEILFAWNFLSSEVTFHPKFRENGFYHNELHTEQNTRAIYIASLIRENPVRNKIRTLFNIREFSDCSHEIILCNTSVTYKQLLTYVDDFKLTPDKMVYDRKTTSLAQIAARKDIDSLKLVIEKWKIVPTKDQVIIINALLMSATLPRNSGIFEYVFNYIITHYPEHIKKINWLNLLSFANITDNNLQKIKILTEYMLNHNVADCEKIIFTFLMSDLKSTSLPVVKFLTEKFNLQQKINKPFKKEDLLLINYNDRTKKDPIAKLFGFESGAMSDENINVLSYLIIELKYDLKSNSREVIKYLYQSRELNHFFKPRFILNNKSIIEYLIKLGLEISLHDLSELKKNATNRHTFFNSIDYYRFDEAYPRYNNVVDYLQRISRQKTSKIGLFADHKEDDASVKNDTKDPTPKQAKHG